jgi:hypothetical protein
MASAFASPALGVAEALEELPFEDEVAVDLVGDVMVRAGEDLDMVSDGKGNVKV